MKIYVNGCSFSYGNSLENKSAWPDFIEGYDVINESWIGSSNKRILRRTLEYIQTHAIHDTFFVIQFLVQINGLGKNIPTCSNSALLY